MRVRELDAPPNVLALYPKAALTGFTRRGGGLPETCYALSGVTVDPAHLARYARVCGFRLSDELPVTYPHVLGFPLQVKLMTDDDFPFPLAGLVHVANRIEQRRALRLSDRPDLRVHAADPRDHPRGRQFDLITETFVAGKLVWTGVSTYLRRAGARSESGTGPGAAEREPRTKPTPPHPMASWHLGADLGRRYGAVAGDRNPIHLHPLAAKAFGFRRAIAHGMWTKARCLAALEGRLPTEYTVDVQFKRPVLLPSKVGFVAHPEGDGWAFEVFHPRTSKPHLLGTVVTR